MFQPLSVFVGLRYSLAREHSFFVSFIAWFSLLGVAVGVAALIVILSIMNGFEDELRTRLLSLSAHATLTSPHGEAIADWPALLTRLKSAPGLEAAAPLLDTDAMLKGQAMSGAILRGIDPVLEPKVSVIGEAMREGRLADLAPGKHLIVLGLTLAYQLQVNVGDPVTVMIADGSAARGSSDAFVPRLQEFTVAGIFEVGLQEQDGVIALIHLADAQALRSLQGPTGIRLRFNDVLQAPQLARQAAALTPGLKARDWTEENAVYFRAVRIEKTMTGVLLMLIVVVAAFNIVATLVMVVNDKRTDIAILRTLGLSPRGVVGIFFTQGLIIGWFGTLLGVIVGLLTALNVSTIVPFLEGTLGFHIFDPDVYYFSTIPSDVHRADVLLIAAAGLILSLLATIYPSLQAARTQPAEALRYE